MVLLEDEDISDDDGLQRDAETRAAITHSLLQVSAYSGAYTDTHTHTRSYIGTQTPGQELHEADEGGMDTGKGGIKEEGEGGSHHDHKAKVMAAPRACLAGSLLDRGTRYLLSTSLDVDIGLPFSRELRGLGKTGQNRRRNFRKLSALDHQTILFNWFRSSEQSQPMVVRGRSEVLRIGYYSEEDVTLGQFLVDNCFGVASKGGALEAGSPSVDQVRSLAPAPAPALALALALATISLYPPLSFSLSL